MAGRSKSPLQWMPRWPGSAVCGWCARRSGAHPRGPVAGTPVCVARGVGLVQRGLSMSGLGLTVPNWHAGSRFSAEGLSRAWVRHVRSKFSLIRG
eukprot:1146841-Pelagomonas_calceolata.AAC.6